MKSIFSNYKCDHKTWQYGHKLTQKWLLQKWVKWGMNSKNHMSIIDFAHLLGILAEIKLKQELTPSLFLLITCKLRRSFDWLPQNVVKIRLKLSNLWYSNFKNCKSKFWNLRHQSKTFCSEVKLWSLKNTVQEVFHVSLYSDHNLR
jgi:hypothetical protein